MTLDEIREKVENEMTLAEAKEFEESNGMTINEFFALAESNILYRALVEVLLSAYFANE